MRKIQPTFHIHHNLSPNRLRVVLSGLKEGHSLTMLAAQCGLSAAVLQRVLIPAIRQLGFLEASGYQVNEWGKRFLSLSTRFPYWFPEAAHLWMYTVHSQDHARGISWAYAQIVDILWAAGEQILDGLALLHLASSVIERASRALGLPTDSIAFSDRSVRGALNWLQDLTPPVITLQGKKRIFRRRFFCPEMTFLWAVDFLYRSLSISFGVRVSLSPERLEQLCRLCVLDPSGVDNVLAAAKRFSDYDRGGLFDFGTEGGWGRWILLARHLPISYLPEEVEG